MKKISALSIGSKAARLLHGNAKARIIGSISKGLFIMTPGNEVFFVSYESYRSPITINLSTTDQDLLEIENGSEVLLDRLGITFPGARIRIRCEGLAPWIPPDPCASADTAAERIGRIYQIANGIEANKPGEGFSPLVSVFILGKTLAAASKESGDIPDQIENIFRASKHRDVGSVGKELEGLLGFGRGLTPSGDDFVLGFLLAANRWGETLGYNRQAVDIFNKQITHIAASKTTSLSCMFIHQAALGLGDERQLAVLDGIMTGNPSMEGCLQYVLETGQSSGIDSFLGMAAGVI